MHNDAMGMDKSGFNIYSQAKVNAIAQIYI
jgi:hypothetical protein